MPPFPSANRFNRIDLPLLLASQTNVTRTKAKQAPVSGSLFEIAEELFALVAGDGCFGGLGFG